MPATSAGRRGALLPSTNFPCILCGSRCRFVAPGARIPGASPGPSTALRRGPTSRFRWAVALAFAQSNRRASVALLPRRRVIQPQAGYGRGILEAKHAGESVASTSARLLEIRAVSPGNPRDVGGERLPGRPAPRSMRSVLATVTPQHSLRTLSLRTARAGRASRARGSRCASMSVAQVAKGEGSISQPPIPGAFRGA